MAGSLQEIAELINFNFADPSRAEYGLIDVPTWWTMFANVPESTCIYVKIDDEHNDQYKTFEK